MTQRSMIKSAPDINWAYPLGFWSALLTTVGGILYFLVIVSLVVTGQFTFPPSDSIQLFGGMISLLFCPVIVMIMVCLHRVTVAERKALSQGSLAFTMLFAMAVSINRFTQLGVVRQSIASGNVDGLLWFLPYGSGSVMFGLEMLGWGWFLGIAMLFASPLFSGGKLEQALRWSMVSYGGLGIVSAVAYLAGSPFAAIGFVAWGLVLFIITALLTVYFRRS